MVQRILITAGLCLIVCGCASSQVAKITAEKEQLVAQLQEQKRAHDQLAAKLDTTTGRLAEAERDLALADRGQLRRPSTSATVASVKPRYSGTAKGSLEEFAKGQPLLKYDSRHRAARVQIDLKFDAGQRLTSDSRRDLGKAADLLADTTASSYSVKITGVEAKSSDSTALARANAAAEYLKLRGISSDRISVTARSSSSPGLDEEGRTIPSEAGAVEIHVVEASGTVGNEGWTAAERK